MKKTMAEYTPNRLILKEQTQKITQLAQDSILLNNKTSAQYAVNTLVFCLNLKEKSEYAINCRQELGELLADLCVNAIKFSHMDIATHIIHTLASLGKIPPHIQEILIDSLLCADRDDIVEDIIQVTTTNSINDDTNLVVLITDLRSNNIFNYLSENEQYKEQIAKITISDFIDFYLDSISTIKNYKYLERGNANGLSLKSRATDSFNKKLNTLKKIYNKYNVLEENQHNFSFWMESNIGENNNPINQLHELEFISSNKEDTSILSFYEALIRNNFITNTADIVRLSKSQLSQKDLSTLEKCLFEVTTVIPKIIQS